MAPSIVSEVLKRNNVLDVNTITGADIHITSHGSDWYWTAFSMFAVATLCFIFVGFLTKGPSERTFFYNSIAVGVFMVVNYFTMASNLGWAPVQAEFNHARVDDSSTTPGMRQIFYCRYIAWFLAFPPTLANLALYAALEIPTLCFNIFAIEVMVITLLAGCVVHSSYKWGYYTICCVAFLIIAYQLVVACVKSAGNVNSRTKKWTTIFAWSLTIIIMIYPLAWALCDGGNVVQPDSESFFYGILDIFAFLIFPSALLWATRDVDFASIGLAPPVKPLWHPSEKDSKYYSGATGSTIDDGILNPEVQLPPSDQPQEPVSATTQTAV